MEPKFPSQLAEGERFVLQFGNVKIDFSREYGQVQLFIPTGQDGHGINLLTVLDNDQEGVKAADLLYEHVKESIEAQDTPKIDFLWTTTTGAWLIKNTTRKEAYEKLIKTRMTQAFPGMSEEDKRAEAESFFVQNGDQLTGIDGELT